MMGAPKTTDPAALLTRRILATDAIGKALRRATSAALVSCDMRPLSRCRAWERKIAMEQTLVAVRTFLSDLPDDVRAQIADRPKTEVLVMLEQAVHGR